MPSKLKWTWSDIFEWPLSLGVPKAKHVFQKVFDKTQAPVKEVFSIDWNLTFYFFYPSIKTIKFSFPFSFEIFRPEWNMTCFRHLWCEKVLMVSSLKMYFAIGQAIDTAYNYIILKLQIKLINQNLCSKTIRNISKVKSSHAISFLCNTSCIISLEIHCISCNIVICAC